MFGSGKRQAEIEGELIRLRGEVAECQREVRGLRLELADMTARVLRYMKRERAAAKADAETADDSPPPPQQSIPLAPAPERPLWGARARRAARQAALGAPLVNGADHAEG